MGLGALWDPNEHPRGWHGRFIKKFKLAPWLDKVLKDFSPRQFQSNNQAAQYAFNQGHKSPGGAFTPEALKRVHLDWDEAQDALRAGKIDPTTQKFVDAMTPHMQPAPEGLILSKTFAPDALGLRPENLNTNPEDQNSILHMIGNTITDKGFSATHLGTNDSHGPGKITMTIAASPGTKVAFSGASRSDRGVFMDRDQKLLVTHVDPDGQGGWYMMAVAEPPGATSGSPQTLVPGRKGAGLSEVQREARVGGPSATTPNIAEPPRAAPQEAQIQGHESVLPGQAPAPTAAKKAAKATRQAGYQKAAANEAAQAGQAPPAAPQPVTPTPAPAPPGNVGVRTEPVHEPIGGTPTEGRSASEIAGTPSQPSTPTPAPAPAPANNGATFKQEFRDRGLQSPSAGPQRREFNNAYLGVTGGKKEPGDALRELDADIEHNKGLLKEMGSNDPKAAELKTNIQRQSELADLMAEHFNEPRTHKTPEAAPAAVTEATKAAKAAPAPRLQTEKNAAAAARRAATGEQKPTVSAARVQPGDKLLVRKGEDGQWHQTKTKTGATAITVTGKESGGGAHVITGKDAAGNEIRTAPIAGQNVLHRHIEKPSAAKAAKATAPEAAPAPEKKAGGFATVKNLSPEERKSYDALSKEGKASYLARRRAGQSHEKALGTEAAKVTPAPKTAKELASLTPAEKANLPVAKRLATAAPAPKAVSEVQTRADAAGLPKTVTGLRASAKEKGIRGFSTMNKEQLQRALLGEEVPRAEKALVSPEKLGPHIQAANTENDAKALMADHTLADLRNLAKANGVDLKGKRTKPQVQDAILKHLRGEETTGIKPEKVTESLDSELKKASVVTPDGPEGEGIRKALSEVDENDPESLRKERDALEKEAARLRAAGDRPAAHLAQGAADVLGMRAQRISGVEEAAPAKKIEKVAPPAGHEDLGGTKADLLKIAAGEGVPHKQAMTKPQLIKAITDHRAGKAPASGSAKMAAKKAAPAGELHLGEARGQAGKLAPTERIKPSGETKPAVTEPARAPKVAAKAVAREGLVPSGKTRGEAGAPTPVKKATKTAPVSRSPEEIKAALDKATTYEEGRAVLQGLTVAELKKIDPDAGRVTTKKADLVDAIVAKGQNQRTVGQMAKGMFSEKLANVKAAEAHPEAPPAVIKATRAKVTKAVPDGSVGTRGAEPIASKPRATEFDQAWDKAGIPSAPDKTSQKSIDEIRSDVSSGKITPEEGIRRMESEISLNQDEIDDINRTIRSGQVSGAELDKLRTQRDRLITSKSAQESASKFMHGHFGKERVTVPEVLDQVKETQGQAWWDGLNKEDPEVFRQELENGTGLKLKGDNAQEIFQDALKQTIQKGLSERAARKTAKKAAKAVPEPNPDFAPGGAKHLDAKAIAGDLNIDQDVLDNAQNDLNSGKTPGQVAKDLERTADARAATNVFQNGGWHTESHPGMPHTPEEQAKRKAEFQAEYDKQAAKIDQIRELANRLKASRRPVARKAAAPKVAEDLAQARQETKNPAVRKQLAQAEQAVKDAGNEAEGLKQRILARHQTAWNEATTEEKAKAATDAMRQDLTLAEIRDWAKPQGITGRSKQDILDKAIARRFGQGGPPEVSGPSVNDRMARASQARAVARALADVEEVKANRGSKLAVSTRAKGMARAGGLPEPLVSRIHAAATSDNQTELNKIAEEHGLTKMAHGAGEVVPYNPRIHDEIGTPGVREGQPVHVISPGYEGVADGRKFTAVKARVQHEPAAKAQATAAAERLRRGPKSEPFVTAEVTPPRNRDAALERERAAAAEAVPAKAAPAKVTAKAAKPARRGLLAGFKPNELNEVPAGAPTTGPKGEKLSAKELEIMDYFGTGSAGHYFTKPTTSADQSAFHRLQQMGLLERKEGERGPSYRPNDEGWKLIHARGGGHGSESMKGKAEAAAPAKAAEPPVGNHHFRDLPKALAPTYRSQGDEKLKLPNGGADQGIIHMDSSIGELWQNLAGDGRVPNSTLNEINQIGDDLGRGKIDVPTARALIRGIKTDSPAVRDRINKAVNDLDVKPSKYDVPGNTPKAVKDWLDEINQIPAFHNKAPNSPHGGETPFDEAVKLIRDIGEGKAGPRGDMELRSIGHGPHESGDGVYESRRAFDKIFFPHNQTPEVRNWFRSWRNKEEAPSPEPAKAAKKAAKAAPKVTQAEIKSPVAKVGNEAPSAPSSVTTKGLVEGEGIPISNRLALENKLSNRNTLNAMDRAVRHEGTRAKVPELFQTLMTQLSQAGVGPNDEPRKSLIEWYNRHFS